MGDEWEHHRYEVLRGSWKEDVKILILAESSAQLCQCLVWIEDPSPSYLVVWGDRASLFSDLAFTLMFRET